MGSFSIVDLWTWSRRFGQGFSRPLLASIRDLLPIISTVAVFQLLIFQQPLTDVASLLTGLILVVLGLTFFVIGLDLALFPLGEQLAGDLAKKGSVFWLLVFAFSLGFGTTFAEPALIAVADEAAKLAALDRIEVLAGEGQEVAFRERYSLVLRTVVAVSVGASLVLGVLRILWGWPIQYLILIGYLLVMALTPFAPSSIVGIAYDSGGVTTSTITVPLTTALGVGLANCIKGRNPLLDGFGLIALASLLPIAFVLLLGIVWV